MLCVNETLSRLDVARDAVTLSQVGSAWPFAVYPQYYPQEFYPRHPWFRVTTKISYVA